MGQRECFKVSPAAGLCSQRGQCPALTFSYHQPQKPHLHKTKPKLCKYIAKYISYANEFQSISKLNSITLLLSVFHTCHLLSACVFYVFALWMDDYKWKQGLNTSVRLAVNIKMALYLFLLKCIEQNIFLVVFMSVSFILRFVGGKEVNFMWKEITLKNTEVNLQFSIWLSPGTHL